MQFFDTHAHISSEALFAESTHLIQEARAQNVLKIINIATDKITLERGLQLSEKNPFIYNTAAITPHDASMVQEDTWEFFKESAFKNKLIAIGETGLDYHIMSPSKEAQKEIFIRHLHLALENHLPLVIHCREAFQDLFALLDKEYLNHPQALPGIMHCFTGTKDEAVSALERGWYISFSGIVTFKKSEELQEIARFIPLTRMLIETDSPYLAPNPLRGKRNQPAFIVHTAQALATIRNISLKELASATWENAHEALNLTI